MEYQALLDEVRTRAALRDTDDARAAIEATVGALAHLVDDPVRDTLVDALPGLLRPVAEEPRAGRPDLGGFLQEVSYRAGCTESEARYRAQATLSALADAEPELGRSLAHALPDEFDELLAPPRTGGGVVATSGGPAPLDEGEVRRILDVDLRDWEGDNRAIRRTISLPPENLNALVEQTRRLDTRLRSGPELTVTGDSATITLTTDTVGAVTAGDVDLARRIDGLIDEASPVIGS